MLDLLLKHPDKIPPWQPASCELRALRQWSESRRMLVGLLAQSPIEMTASAADEGCNAMGEVTLKDT
ncbi:hypothetical protein [Thermoleptolyngbya oregonensis]|uniref:hypothetical protein n=1 Tax=Thermoleptolyngbya oregonensis TaxID=2303529 RepID=UPI00292D16DF|nr:hypothetical protein [Thermoleptolyngbya oregonensis]